MTYSQEKSTLVADPIYCNPDAFSQCLLPIIDPSNYPFPDLEVHSTYGKRPLGTDNALSRMVSSNGIILSQNCAETDFIESQRAVGTSPMEKAIDVHGSNQLPAINPSNYHLPSLGVHYTSRDGLDDTDNSLSRAYLSEENEVPRSYAGTDFDDFRPLPAIPQLGDGATIEPIQCWLHDCNGRSFTHLSNYRRHCREKSGLKSHNFCRLCSRRFTRKAAWKVHVNEQRCKFINYDANGVAFERSLRSREPRVESFDNTLRSMWPLDDSMSMSASISSVDR
jgi:hypothetical protein